MTEHGLHPGCVPKTYQAILISRAPTHIKMHVAAPKITRKTPAKIRKTLAKTRKRPQVHESGEFV